MAAQFDHVHIMCSIKTGHDHHNANNSRGEQEKEGKCLSQLKCGLIERGMFPTHLVCPES